jgi:translocation and assembly module TamA
MKNTRQYIAKLLLLFSFSLAAYADEVNLRTQLIGITDSPLTNVQAQLDIAIKAMGKDFSENSIRAFYRNAPSIIQQGLAPYGYFHALVKSQLRYANHTWLTQFTIKPGQPTIIRKLTLGLTGEGHHNPTLIRYLQAYPISKGQVFSTEPYESAKSQFFEKANDQGYVKALLKIKTVTINKADHTADVNLLYDTQARYYFTQFHFIQETFSTDFLTRFLNVKPGQPFSSKKLLKLQQNLTNSHFFKSVAVNPDFVKNQTAVPVDIHLVPNKAQQYKLGAGYGTFTGPRLTIESNFRHLTQTGHHLNIEIKVSPVLSGFASEYVIPGKNPLEDQYALGGNAQKFLPKNGYSFSETIYGAYIQNLRSWKRNIRLNYLRERFFNQTKSTNTAHNSHVTYPSMTLSRTHADNLLNPSKGLKINLSLRGASDKFYSTTRFIQGEISSKVIFSPTEASRVILLGDLGYTIVHNGSRLPISLQFLAGGLNSIRGYQISQYGPGRYLEVANAEIHHRIKGNLFGAIFYDIGTASDLFKTHLNRGTGVGIVYHSLIGPLKFYVVHPIDHPKKRWGFEFSIGPEL